MEDKLLCEDKDKVPCRRGKARKGDCIVEKKRVDDAGGHQGIGRVRASALAVRMLREESVAAGLVRAWAAGGWMRRGEVRVAISRPPFSSSFGLMRILEQTPKKKGRL